MTDKPKKIPNYEPVPLSIGDVGYEEELVKKTKETKKKKDKKKKKSFFGKTKDDLESQTEKKRKRLEELKNLKKGGMVDKRSPFMGGGIAYAGGGKAMPRVKRAGGGPGLYANIAAKKRRIAAGSGETMRKPGSKGAPTAANFKRAAQTAKS